MAGCIPKKVNQKIPEKIPRKSPFSINLKFEKRKKQKGESKPGCVGTGLVKYKQRDTNIRSNMSSIGLISNRNYRR